MNNKSFVIAFLILCFVTALSAIIVASITRLPEHYRLTKNGVESQGFVVSKQSHDYLEVQYEVNGQKHKTGGHPSDIEKVSVNIGEKVTIYFDPQNPAIATLGNPENHLRSNLIETGIVSIVPTILFLGFLFKRKAD
ncbi:MAG TPA: DUF3592 domain-containing protein [Pyrinomonadaceae bacterium]|nr:DUF3592 domain-containing protein [Pyrinomonadaceae bacterium]